MLYLSTRYMKQPLDTMAALFQALGGPDPAADPGPAADRRGLRLQYPREPAHSPAQGVAASGVSAPRGPGRHSPRRLVGVLPARRRRPILSSAPSGSPSPPRSATSRASARTPAVSRRKPGAALPSPVASLPPEVVSRLPRRRRGLPPSDYGERAKIQPTVGATRNEPARIDRVASQRERG